MIEIIYLISVLMWLIASILQSKIIKDQDEVIALQNKLIDKYETKMQIQNCVIKEHRELSAQQKKFIQILEKNNSASEAYQQTYRKEEEKCSE